MCSVDKRKFFGQSNCSKSDSHVCYTQALMLASMLALMLLAVALLSTQTADYEFMLVSLLSLVSALQPILILVAASVRESTLVLRQLLIHDL